jgi:hypothetical protein
MNNFNFEVGKIYNIRKVGSSKAWENSTHLVTGLVPIRTVELFSSSPNSFTLRSGPLIFPDQFSWEGYEVKEVFDESEYIKYSMHTTLREALDSGLIKMETLESKFHGEPGWAGSPLIGHGGRMSLQLNCEKGVSDNPFLCKLVFVWKSYYEAKDDILSVCPAACFDE